jgi:hypothetical protein
MVVTLNLEYNSVVITDVDHARVLAWSDDYLGTSGWKGCEVNLGALVGTVFRKKRGADAKLHHVDLPPESGFYRGILRLSKTVFFSVLDGSGSSPGGCGGHTGFLLSAVRAEFIPERAIPQSFPANRGALELKKSES